MSEAPLGSDQTPESSRRALFIAGSGRSGTSALACSLQTLGMHVPAPEVPADETNPKGFGESQWVVDFHDRMLNRCNVRVGDARPSAWFDAGKLATVDKVREEVIDWLARQFTDEADELVIKDPRLAWFLGVWRSAALRSGVQTSHVVMLRPPTEVVGSKQKYYSAKVSEISRTASWINHMLHTERATRGSLRGFITYHQLLDDWTVPIYSLGERFDLGAVKTATAKDLRRVHDFIDPDLHRIRTTWDELDVPKSLRTLAEETWHQLSVLTDPARDTAAAHAGLDDLRLEYTNLYEEAEAIAQSSIVAAANRRKRRNDDEVAQAPAQPAGPVAAASDEATARPRGLRAALGRRKA